jgi:hypothetical protein
MILGIDPGKKPGYAIVAATGIVYMGRELPVLGSVQRILCERPRLRVGGRRLDPNSIVTLACTAGEQMGRACERYPQAESEWVDPRKWKGTIPKEIMTNRIRRFAEQLDGYDPKKANSDVLDALGLALWGLGHDWNW